MAEIARYSVISQGAYCLCGEAKFQKIFSVSAHQIVRCSACSQARVITPVSIVRKQVYKAEDLQVYIDKEQLFRSLFVHLISFIKLYKAQGILVDIGAGAGLLVSEARKSGFTSYGFEPSKTAIRIAKKYFHVTISPKKFSAKNFGKHADVVVLNHVLEHLPKPKQMIAEITAALNTGGLFVVGVPNFGGFMAQTKRAKWQSLIPDQHRWQFTISTLDQLVLPFGYQRLGMYTENHDRSMHYWWKRPLYGVLDKISLLVHQGEAMLIIYQKT